MAEIRARVQPPGPEAIRPTEERAFLHKKVLGFAARQVVKLVPGGSVALQIGQTIRQRLLQKKRPRTQFTGPDPRFAGPATTRVESQQFRPVEPTAAEIFFGETPRVTGPQGQAVVGAFDMPAIVPLEVPRITLDCPPGMVLGKDDLCYPKQVLRRNSQFRKWRSSPRPTISRRDERALAKISQVQKDIKALGKKAGLKVTG